MITRIRPFPALSFAAAAMWATLTLNLQPSPGFAQGTAFTYQGRLASGAQAANGIYDLRFAIYDAAADGSSVAGPITNSPVGVTNGLFTTTLDFGGNVFTGQARWLDIAVRTNGGGGFTALAPRQPLTPSPYALYAPSAGAASVAATATTATTVANNGVTAAGIASGQVVKSLNSLHDDVTLAAGANLTLTPGGQMLTLASPADWHLGGNSGTTAGTHFLGTADNQPLEFKVNNSRALRLEPNGNVVAGAANNSIATYASTIGGGSGNQIQTNANNSVIAGGSGNQIQGSALYGAILGVIGGGYANVIEPYSYYALIAGGSGNRLQYDADRAVISGGGDNIIHTNADYATIGGGSDNKIETNSTYATIGGGDRNSAAGEAATCGGGSQNQATNDWATVAGGSQNLASGYTATIGGGYNNRAGNNWATVGGGWGNLATGRAATVPGGYNNAATASYSFAAGRRARANHIGAVVWADSTDADFGSTRADEFSIRATGGVRIESGLGIGLNPANNPLITRGYDPFTSGAYTGLGRWGLFMEPFNLVLGIPNVGGRNFQVAKYETDGTRTALVTVDQAGNLYTLGLVNPPSDRAVKEDFAPVDSQAVLEHIARLPLQTWAYTNSPTVRHLGPVAQDFHAAFGLGADDKHIATVDADGVALAAIQGLNEKVELSIQELRAENAELKARLEKLEQLLNQKNGGGL